MDFPIIYFPNLIIAIFLSLGVLIGYCRHKETLLLTNLVIVLGFCEKLAFLTQVIVAFMLGADKYGGVCLLAFMFSIALNCVWHFHFFKKKVKDPSFEAWQKDFPNATAWFQRLSLVFSFKMTRLHFSKFAGLPIFKAGFQEPNTLWYPLIWVTIAHGVLVSSIFVTADLVGLATLEHSS